jgi:lipoic acid synthetase
LGEKDDEVMQVLRDLREHHVEMLTLGQYLQPSEGHLPVLRYVEPDTFKMFEDAAKEMGFSHAACGPMVRSSYFADVQAEKAGISTSSHK